MTQHAQDTWIITTAHKDGLSSNDLTLHDPLLITGAAQAADAAEQQIQGDVAFDLQDDPEALSRLQGEVRLSFKTLRDAGGLNPGGRWQSSWTSGEDNGFGGGVYETTVLITRQGTPRG